MPLKDPATREEFPDYQPCVTLAWLKTSGLVHPHGHQGYTPWNHEELADSLERIIEQNKDRYYETLEESSAGWHEGGHDPWPCINYLLFVLKSAYGEFEQRLAQTKTPRGVKTGVVVAAIKRIRGNFSVADLQNACPGVSIDMIRYVLKALKKSGEVQPLGRSRNALWRRLRA